MSEKRLTLGYSLAAIVMAFAIIGASLYMNPFANAKTGVLAVKVTDAPVPDLKNLYLTISSFEVLNKTGSWITLPIKDGVQYFDLLKLRNVTKDLAIGSLPVGNFSKIRLTIDTATATLSDGTKIDLNAPPGHIDLQVKFEIKAGKTTALVIDIIVDKIEIAERGSTGKPANLNPQFKFLVVPPDNSS